MNIEFAASAAVLESIGTFKVLVCRHGKLTSTVRVRVETIDGSANEGEDYQAINEVLTFEPHEREKQVRIVIEVGKLYFTFCFIVTDWSNYSG